MSNFARWDQSKFDRTFEKYMEHASRDLVTAINTKAWYIARKATWFTHKADAGKIQSQLGRRVTVSHSVIKNGAARMVKRSHMELTQARDHDAPLAALIVNKRRGRKGEKGLQGREMVQAIRDMLAFRMSSIAYTKSGWLPAIRALASLADRTNPPPMDTTAKARGRVKGEAVPALALHSKSAATILNEAWAKHDSTNAFYRYGASGLQRAFNDEAASMSQYIRRKMLEAESEFNAAQR